nr:MAG TPA: hypothetical protein [Caudoviricetes sp.]
MTNRANLLIVMEILYEFLPNQLSKGVFNVDDLSCRFYKSGHTSDLLVDCREERETNFLRYQIGGIAVNQDGVIVQGNIGIELAGMIELQKTLCNLLIAGLCAGHISRNLDGAHQYLLGGGFDCGEREGSAGGQHNLFHILLVKIRSHYGAVLPTTRCITGHAKSGLKFAYKVLRDLEPEHLAIGLMLYHSYFHLTVLL